MPCALLDSPIVIIGVSGNRHLPLLDGMAYSYPDRERFLVGASQVTIEELLGQLESGNRAALDELYALVYQELAELAHRLRRRWHGDHTLNTTALIHEAYLKLLGQRQVRVASRAHFLALAAKVMRHVLINYARDRRAQAQRPCGRATARCHRRPGAGPAGPLAAGSRRTRRTA